MIIGVIGVFDQIKDFIILNVNHLFKLIQFTSKISYNGIEKMKGIFT